MAGEALAVGSDGDEKDGDGVGYHGRGWMPPCAPRSDVDVQLAGSDLVRRRPSYRVLYRPEAERRSTIGRYTI